MTTDTKDRPSAAELMALVDAYAETAAVNGIRSQWAQMARGKVELALKQLPAPQAQADARDAERYRALRDERNQLHEDDISVSDSSFNTYFGDELDKASDALIARTAAIAAAKGE